MTFPLLANRVAFVTGAATGIGEGVARLFASQGAHVYVLDVNREGAESVAQSIVADGGSAFAQRVDVRSAPEIQSAVEEARQRFGRIDVLINNAGIYPRRMFLEMTDGEWDEMQDVNLKGVYRCCRAVLPAMVAQGGGAVVNISSVTFHLGTPNLSHYVAAKGGVIGLTRSLAREMGPHNVRVNCITPGAIEVEQEKKVATAEQMAAIVAQQCLQRRLGPADVAQVCLFLASEMSAGMTGQTVNVDAGLAMY